MHKDKYFHSREIVKEFMMSIVKIFRFRTWQIELKKPIIKILNNQKDKADKQNMALTQKNDALFTPFSQFQSFQ